MNNMKQLGVANLMYADDSNEYLVVGCNASPDANEQVLGNTYVWPIVLMSAGYMREKQSLICPADSIKSIYPQDERVTYTQVAGSDKAGKGLTRQHRGAFPRYYSNFDATVETYKQRFDLSFALRQLVPDTMLYGELHNRFNYYRYNGSSGSVFRHATIELSFEHPGYRANFLFVDGHIETLDFYKAKFDARGTRWKD